MKIYDISQEIYSCKVYPGDPRPERIGISSIKNGDVCNLSGFRMCAHNGTHIDAPNHFIDDGATVDKIPLERLIGYAFVAECNGDIGREKAEELIEKAKSVYKEPINKILIKGEATVTEDGAEVFSNAGLELIGNESQTVGPEDAPMQVHLTLLNADVVILEGIRLTDVPSGVYFLNAAPLNLEGGDGSPCRAVLIDFNK